MFLACRRAKYSLVDSEMLALAQNDRTRRLASARGDDAKAQAGRMKQPLRMWVLWPRT